MCNHARLPPDNRTGILSILIDSEDNCACFSDKLSAAFASALYCSADSTCGPGISPSPSIDAGSGVELLAPSKYPANSTDLRNTVKAVSAVFGANPR